MAIYLIRGYSKTGIYAVTVEADNAQDAMDKALPELEDMSFGPILKFTVDKEKENG